MRGQGTMKLGGELRTRKITPPGPGVGWHLRNRTRWSYILGWFTHRLAHAFTRLTGAPVMLGSLKIRLFRADGSIVDFGTVGWRVVTTEFVNFMVDQLQAEDSTWGDFLHHDSGVGTTAENVADTDIETTDGESRASGTQTEGAANIYESVGTISYTTTKAITEHGLFNHATLGELMDRTVFTVINVVNGDSIQFTYDLTVTAGS